MEILRVGVITQGGCICSGNQYNSDIILEAPSNRCLLQVAHIPCTNSNHQSSAMSCCKYLKWPFLFLFFFVKKFPSYYMTTSTYLLQYGRDYAPYIAIWIIFTYPMSTFQNNESVLKYILMYLTLHLNLCF